MAKSHVPTGGLRERIDTDQEHERDTVVAYTSALVDGRVPLSLQASPTGNRANSENSIIRTKRWETPMRQFLIYSLIATVGVTVSAGAFAETKADKCAAYARSKTAETPTSTGVARGATRGAVGAAIVGAKPGRGAAVGAAVGGTRGAAQKGRSYDSYYSECMARK